MPVAKIPAEEANHNLRHSRASLWPDDRVPGERLKGVPKVELNPSFGFTRQDRILTLGSCFAREMENRLVELGFDAPLARVSVPADERITKMQNDLLIKYTIQSIENELRWAAGEAAPPPEKLFLELGDGRWHDPQLVHNAPPLPFERVAERRAMVQAATAQFPSCRVVIITLGLAEAWFDEETRLYLNTAPPAPALRRYPGRFRLDVLAYEDILGSLERIWDLLSAKGPADLKMLITVSPVPFKATFSGQDAIMANTYSKAVQRAACEAFVRRHAGVDYFPSYEIVTLSPRELAYERDNTHVAPAVIRYITDSVLKAYAPEIEVEPAPVEPPATRREGAEGTHFDLFVLAKHHISHQEFEEAEAACRELIGRFGGSISARDLAIAHGLLAGALMGRKDWAAAAGELERAAGLDAQDGVVAYKLGQCRERLEQWDEAVAAFRSAVALNSARPEYAKALARAEARAAEAARAAPSLAGIGRS